LTLAVPVLITGFLLGGLLGHYFLKDYHEQAHWAQNVQALDGRRAELTEETRRLQARLKEPGAQGTIHQVDFVNALIGRKRLSLPDLTTKIAALLPPDVRLTSLVMIRSGNECDLRFQLAGRNESALETFMKNLQKSADFADPQFTTEGTTESSGPQGPVPEETTLVCQTRYIALGRPAADNKSRRQ
jgi:Tfp pilus assembly protein PilN